VLVVREVSKVAFDHDASHAPARRIGLCRCCRSVLISEAASSAFAVFAPGWKVGAVLLGASVAVVCEPRKSNVSGFPLPGLLGRSAVTCRTR